MSLIVQAHVSIDLRGLKEFEQTIAAQLNHQQQGPITEAFNKWAVRYRSFIRERFDVFSKGGGDWPPLKDSTKARRRVGKGAPPKPRRPKIKRLRNGKPSVQGSKGPKGRSANNVAKAANLRKRIGRLKKQLVKVGRNKKLGFLKRLAKRYELNRKIRKARSQFKKSKRAALVSANNKSRASYKKSYKKWLSKRKFGILRDTGTMFAALSPVFVGKPGQLQDGIPFGVRVGFGGVAKHPKSKATVADIATFHQTGAGYLPIRLILVAPPQPLVEAMTADMMRAIKRVAGNESDGNPFS